MRARMALFVAGVDYELREIVLRNKPAHMLEISPKGTVPVLFLGDAVIDESRDVMRWALRKAPAGFEGASADNEALIDLNDGDFKHHLDRYKYANRYDDADPTHHRMEGEKFLATLDERLSSAPYLSGDNIGEADIAIFPFVRQFRIADPDWFDQCKYENMRAWLAKCMGDEIFTSVMKKYSPWVDGDTPIAGPRAA